MLKRIYFQGQPLFSFEGGEVQFDQTYNCPNTPAGDARGDWRARRNYPCQKPGKLRRMVSRHLPRPGIGHPPDSITTRRFRGSRSVRQNIFGEVWYSWLAHKNDMPLRQPEEKIGIFIPRRNIETWLLVSRRISLRYKIEELKEDLPG